MAAQTGLSAPAVGRGGLPAYPPMALTEVAPFTPMGTDGWQLSSPSDAEKTFSRCAAKLRALRGDSCQLREELNLLFDQLLSENYNKTFYPNINIQPEVAGVLCLLVETTNFTCATGGKPHIKRACSSSQSWLRRWVQVSMVSPTRGHETEKERRKNKTKNKTATTGKYP